MKAWVRDDDSTLDRYPDGRAPLMPQGVGFRPGASSGRASGEPGPRVAPGREGHTPGVTWNREELAESASDEESRGPTRNSTSSPRTPAPGPSSAVRPGTRPRSGEWWRGS